MNRVAPNISSSRAARTERANKKTSSAGLQSGCRVGLLAHTGCPSSGFAWVDSKLNPPTNLDPVHSNHELTSIKHSVNKSAIIQI